jgi:hypothetical protein
MPQLSELLDEAVGDQPVRFSTVDVRRRSRQLGNRRRARRVLGGATAVALSVGAVVAIADGADRGANGPPTATRAETSPTTTPTSTISPSSTGSAPSSSTTTIEIPSAQALLAALRSDPFDTASLPSHVHALGVGPWHYADAGHVGSGYVGSAQVRLRSDTIGESFVATYDVFVTTARAAAWFSGAYSNFRSAGPPGSVRIPPLAPPVDAFCAPQAAPPATTTCWFLRGSTTGIVTATTPTRASSGDTDAVLQAMLTHLVALGD